MMVHIELREIYSGWEKCACIVYATITRKKMGNFHVMLGDNTSLTGVALLRKTSGKPSVHIHAY
jgi:hypothetical protein